jgi:hypothetical protein
MRELFSLGKIYVSDFLAKDFTPTEEGMEMKMMLESETGAVRLEKCAPLNTMFGKYWYRSGINQTMKKELKEIVNSITNTIKLSVDDLWIDIACNDGTLLSFIPNGITKVGIDPADDSFKEESQKVSDLIIQDFFSAEVFKKSKFGHKKAKVITTIAMFYDLENPTQFVNDITEILDENGVWVLQLSYTPLMIQQLAFDNICHEHIYYYSLFNIQKIFKSCGMDIVDVQLNDVNGGSFRLYCMKESADKTKFATQPYRDVCNFRIQSLLSYEKTLKLDEPKIWLDFFEDINKLKNEEVIKNLFFSH